jgi:Spy/CpxP family protein refolding chaperone
MFKKVLIMVASVTIAQSSMATGQGTELDELRRYFIRPELVMRNQHELQLTEEQRGVILHEVQEAQSQFTSMRWDLQSEVEQLRRLVGARDLDEEALLDQFDKVSNLERAIKRTQLILAVRIRAALNDEQLRKLGELRDRERVRTRNNRQRVNPPPPPQ